VLSAAVADAVCGDALVVVANCDTHTNNYTHKQQLHTFSKHKSMCSRVFLCTYQPAKAWAFVGHATSLKPSVKATLFSQDRPASATPHAKCSTPFGLADMRDFATCASHEIRSAWDLASTLHVLYITGCAL
jgi:hypothetical protein